ncbi:hypothetical protein P4S73_17785 [Paraglaciecola sp. Hal342]
MQIVASTLHSVLQGKELKHRFESDTRLTTLPICINQPIWLSSEALSCSANWQGAARLGCDITQLSHSLSEQDFTHIVVLADTGKANVHNGVMFLDSKDDYNVFVHELAHFAGFVDEYPLSSALARSICHTNNAPNLRVRQGQEKPVIKEWLSHGNKEGVTISPARTCDNHPWQAYKPSQKMTFMEFYDVPYIPKFYLKAWAERLGQKPLLTLLTLIYTKVMKPKATLNKVNTGVPAISNTYKQIKSVDFDITGSVIFVRTNGILPRRLTMFAKTYLAL